MLVPTAVLTELLHEDAPEGVREWASYLPLWVSIQESPVRNTTGLEKLQAGEQGAILLAESANADMILLDEKSARRVSAERGLRIIGTLGLLAEAATRGLVDLPAAVDRLRRTTFRCSPALMKATLDRFGSR